MAKISGTARASALTVFRSNKQIYAQVVDDLSGKTLASASSRAIKEAQGVAKIEQAKMVGRRWPRPPRPPASSPSCSTAMDTSTMAG